MAFEGELVRMENGRWARYQSLHICNAGQQASEASTILVAVELDGPHQQLLTEAESTLAPDASSSAPSRPGAESAVDDSRSSVH